MTIETKLGKYLVIHSYDSPSGKTTQHEIYSEQHGHHLGLVKWMGRWRQYAFYPAPETIWNRECLSDINTLITKLMNERKKLHA